MIRPVLLAAGFAASLAIALDAGAQTYPARPITMVVPLAPGGSTDVIARIMAEGMRTVLGQPTIVENTSGAGGSIGVGRVARASPDGYTIGIGQWGTNVASGAIYSLSYDLLKDFEPIALVATQPFLIVARKTMPANDLKELIAWLKANTERATQGNSGAGTPRDIIVKLNGAVVSSLADAAIRQKLIDLSQDIFPREQQTPEALGAYQKAEIEKWWPIIKAADIKAE